ncbi:hypothetical protein [Mycolicibacterium sp. CR10]|uniref:hypothetical protein n=1 Tax=Mycolicibacterium sp. CR10 TaxID=2562314 RepID=UPI0010C127AC|nr:hypothetical protein [Mycolicibacterium sp. CR10]
MTAWDWQTYQWPAHWRDFYPEEWPCPTTREAWGRFTEARDAAAPKGWLEARSRFLRSPESCLHS